MLLIKCIIQKRKKLFIQCVIISLSLFLATIVSNQINKKKLGESQEIAGNIIDALEEYKKKEWVYPNSLAQLIPKLIAEIPKANVGLINRQEFFYQTLDNKEKFELGFPYVASMASYYDSELREWEVDD